MAQNDIHQHLAPHFTDRLQLYTLLLIQVLVKAILRVGLSYYQLISLVKASWDALLSAISYWILG